MREDASSGLPCSKASVARFVASVTRAMVSPYQGSFVSSWGGAGAGASPPQPERMARSTAMPRTRTISGYDWPRTSNQIGEGFSQLVEPGVAGEKNRDGGRGGP